MIDGEVGKNIIALIAIIFLITPPIALLVSFCSYIGKVWAIRLLFSDRRKNHNGDETK